MLLNNNYEQKLKANHAVIASFVRIVIFIPKLNVQLKL